MLNLFRHSWTFLAPTTELSFGRSRRPKGVRTGKDSVETFFHGRPGSITAASFRLPRLLASELRHLQATFFLYVISP